MKMLRDWINKKLKESRKEAEKSREAMKLLRDWINKRLKESRKAYREAEKSREDSGWDDIDALEQSCYNEGVIDALEDIRARLPKKGK